MPVMTSPLPPVRDKAQLAGYLKEAAILEHQFMCQYLYAAFSLKKSPDAQLSPAQFEHVRRWASTLYMIARQEMEHLSIANSLLTAIGAPPYLGHLGFPTQSPWYQADALAPKRAADTPAPCDLPFVLAPFDLTCVRRFACMESPSVEDVRPADRDDVLSWCYQDERGACPCVMPGREVPRVAAFAHVEAVPDTVEPGTVQALYTAIADGFRTLDETLGSAALFDGHPSGQAEIPSEYNLYLFRICDLESALAGIDLVVRQGEGIDTPPGTSSHFQHFVDMARDYAALSARGELVPARRLPRDPRVEDYGDPLARAAAGLWSRGYALLLEMLTGYYAHYTRDGFRRYPHLSAALEQTAFAPLMTMLMRSLAEILTDLPGPAPGEVAGPTFELDAETRALLADPGDPRFTDIGFYVDRMAAIAAGCEALLGFGPPPELARKITFMHQSMARVVANLTYIYRKGIFPRFDPSVDATCDPADSCK